MRQWLRLSITGEGAEKIVSFLMIEESSCPHGCTELASDIDLENHVSEAALSHMVFVGDGQVICFKQDL
jgi:hypothetical protein